MNLPCRLLVLLAACAAQPLIAAEAPGAAAAWKNRCAKCHGEDGRGDTKIGRKVFIGDLTDAKLQSMFTDTEAFNAVKSGLKDAKGKVIMKPVPGLADDEIKALVGYVRALKH